MEHEKHYFKRTLSLLLSLVMIMSVFTGLNITASAGTTSDGFEYEIVNGEATITGYTGSQSVIETPLSIDGYPVVSIGERAFYYNDLITIINISEGVTSLGDFAFESCYSLVRINLPLSLKKIGLNCFYNDYNLKQLTIPENVEKIDSSAFEYSGLTSIKLGNGISEISNDLFYGCSSLKSIEIPQSVKTIGSYAFSGCEELETVVLYEGLESIGEWAFNECVNLKNMELPQSLKTIGDAAFIDCSSIEEVNLTGNLSLIDRRVFKNCTSLKTVELSDNINIISSSAFANCKSLAEIELPTNLQTISSMAFDNCISLKKITIPENVTEIGDGAFENCTSLKSVTMNCNIICINSSVFRNTAIREIEIPDSVSLIYACAFENCTNLVAIAIPKSLALIHEYAFVGCDNIKDVYYEGTKEEWENITISESETGILNARIHYETTYNHYDYANPTVINATCIDEGLEIYTCPCGHKMYFDIPAKGHTVVTDKAVAPTCTKTGLTEGSHCSECGEVIVAQQTVAVKAHTYKNGECTTCGKWQYKSSAVAIKSVANNVSGVQITWNKLAGAEKYLVYRKTAKSGWTKVGTTAGTSIIDKTAKSNTKYWYTVKAQNGSEYSKYNTKGVAVSYMAAPKISKIENTASGVKVTWGKVSGATTYYVYRKTTGGWTRIATAKSTSYTDKKAKAGTTYTYTIRAAKSGATSAAGASKKITRLTVPKLSKLTASKGKNTLTFGKVTGATSYAIYRKTGSGKWVKIATTKSTKYVDKKVKKGTTYTYTVRAVKGSYTSYYNTKGLKVRAK